MKNLQIFISFAFTPKGREGTTEWRGAGEAQKDGERETGRKEGKKEISIEEREERRNGERE